MRHLFTLLIYFIFCYPAFSQNHTLSTVPNPKDKGNYYVSNPDGILTEVDEMLLNNLMDSLERQTSNQVAIVVLDSIGEEVPKDFATALFKEWGIGKRGKDNGLLLLLVKSQRRVEIETGYGLEPILTDGTCKIIGEREMVPAFKEGQYGVGIIKGMAVIADILRQPENKALVDSYIEKGDKLSAEEKSDIIFWVGAFHMLIVAFVFIGGIIKELTVKSLAKKMLQVKAPVRDPSKSRFRWLVLYVLVPLVFYGALNVLDFDSLFFAFAGAVGNCGNDF